MVGLWVGESPRMPLEPLPNDWHLKCSLLMRSFALPSRGEGVPIKVPGRKRALGAELTDR